MSDWIMLEKTKDYSSDQRVLIGNLEYIMNSQMQGPLKEIAWQKWHFKQYCAKEEL